jgi:hypothetical protein
VNAPRDSEAGASGQQRLAIDVHDLTKRYGARTVVDHV